MFPKKKILSFGLCQFPHEKHLSIYSGPISTIDFSRTEGSRDGPTPSHPGCPQILSFSLLKPIRTHADNSDKYMDIKELSETALLDHAMTSKKRSKAIEEFLKLTFKSQVDSNCCHEDLVNLGLFSFEFSLKSSSI